jgi:hypothetical protein
MNFLYNFLKKSRVGAIALLMMVGFGANAQTTYDWQNTAPDGNWKQGAGGAARWNPGNLWDEPSFGVIRFDNNHQLTMTNNVAGTYNQFMMVFGAGNNTTRTINGNPMGFFDFGGNNPKIENFSTANHVINLNFSGDNNNPLEVNFYNSGNLTFNGSVNNNGSFINLFGTVLARTAEFNGVVSGGGGFGVNQGQILLLNNINTYTGNTEVNRGELWINTTGNAIANNNTFIGNGGALTDIAKIFLSRTAGGTNFTRNVTINPGNLATRFIGSINTSGTNEFSGVITNNSGTGLEVQVINAGGTLLCSGDITNTTFISKIGAGILEYGGTAKTYSGTTIVNSGILRLAAANQINNASRLQLNGGTFSTGATTGFTETLGQLELTENSTIALGTGASTLTFAASELVPWTAGKILTITGWNGACNGRIFVGTANTHLTATQLAQINFTGYGTGASLSATGELLPALYNNVIVTSTTGTATTAGYATVGAAFTAINGGILHTGAVTVSIFNNTTETTAASLNQVAGVTSVLVVPAGCGARTVTGTASTISLINLFGADNVTIDGLNTGGNSLTIDNPYTLNGADGSTIRFQGDASSNIVTNCTVLGSSTNANATNGGTISFTTGTTTGNDNNTVSFCNIGPSGVNLPRKAIFFGGNSTGAASALNNSDNTITNCNIYDYFSATATNSGLYLGSGTAKTIISNNKFYQTGTRTCTVSASDHSAIQIENTAHGQDISITGNTIGFASSTGTGTYTFTAGVASKFYPIIFNGVTAVASTINNNTIAGISSTTSSSTALIPGIFAGVRVDAGLVNINSNKIGNASATGGIFVNTTTGGGGGAIYGILSTQTSGNPTINTNNIAYITTGATTASATYNFYGIYTLGAASYTIDRDTIGDAVADNIKIGVSGTSTGIASLSARGILNSSTSSSSITNNIIRNISLYSTAANTTTAGNGLLRGIETSSATAINQTITGNTVSNLKSNAAFTTTPPALIGIFNSSTGTINISSNTIFALNHTNSGTGTYHIAAVRTNAGTGTCSKNKIHSLSTLTTATATNFFGLNITGGTWNISNNIIRLGINDLGASIGGNHDIQGIFATSGTSNIYHNSIYIGGAQSSTQVTYGIQSGSSNNVKNNIIVNARTSATPNTQIALLFNGIGGTTQDANLYYAPNAGGLIAKSGATNYSTLTALQGVAAGRDINSVNSDPKFISATGTAALVDLHINTASATEVESGGLTGLGIVDDIDADLRCPTGGCPGASTKPDIGADEGLFIPADLTPPVVGAFTIPNQANTTAPTVSVTISDNVAVTTTATVNRPRLYYKKCADVNQILGNTNTTAGWKYVEATNATSPFSFTIDYTLLQGGVTAGSFINYFVVAQDAANNVGINSPLTFATTPTNINLTTSNLPTPSNFANYVIQITGGAVTIGTGGTFGNITGACGCFAAVNASTALLASNINATVISDLVEDNNTQLTATGTSFATAFTINITPSAATMRTISTTIGGTFPSSTTTANMIGISGNSKVNLNGNFGGSGQFLTFRSTNATAANTYPCIKVNANTAGTTSLTVANSILEGNSTDDAVGLILVNASGNTVSLTATGNDFRDARGGTAGAYSTAIYFNLPGAAQTANIDGNKIYNFNRHGIFFYASGVNTINANRFYQESTSASTLARSIYLGTNGATTHTVTNNIIGGSTATNTGTWTNSDPAVLFEGISIIAPAATNKGIISGNIIKNISLTGTTTSSFSGINVASGAYDITGNTVGDAITANSIQHAGTGQVTGIYYSTTTTTATDVNTNTIGNITTNTTTNSFGFVGIYVSTSNTVAGNMQGNIIKTISVAPSTTAATAAYGINIGAGVYNVGTTTANTIDGISNSGDGSALNYPYTIGITTATTGGINTIQNNTVTNLNGSGSGLSVAVKGIWINGNQAHRVNNNTITNLSTNSNSSIILSTAPGAAITAIETKSNVGGQQINNNTISNISAASTSGASNAVGINFTSPVTVTGTQIGNNKISNIKNASTAGATARVVGINMNFGGNVVGNAVTVFNNMISLNNNDNTNNNKVIGIREATALAQFNNYFYNSVNIYGTAAAGATNSSHAFMREAGATAATVDVKNNIFQNLRTGGTGKHIAISNSKTGVLGAGWTSNFNALYASDATSIGEWGAGNPLTFANWKTNSSGDANAVNSQAYFVDALNADLHLTTNNCALENKGTVVAITTDYDAATRSASTPDIGADEFTALTLPTSVGLTGTTSICSGSNTNLALTITGIPASSTWNAVFTSTPTINQTGITASPHVFAVSPVVNTTYTIDSLKSGSCYITSGFTPATATVTVIPAGGALWTGVTNTDWNIATNWSCSGIPTSSTNVVIPVVASTNYPIITTTANAANINIATGATVTVNGVGVFNLYGTITNSGILDATAGTINLAASGVSLSGATIKDKTVKNLTISGNTALSATAGDTLKVLGFVRFVGSNNNFTTNGNLTLVSNATGTASVADATNNGANSGNTITGDVNVERYLPTNRKWRFLAVNTLGAQTVQNSWMEGQTPGANAGQAGRGAWITRGQLDPSTTGFDATSVTASMKYWAGTDYINMTDPTIFDLKSQPAYMTFVRGDRSCTGANGTVNATTLRTRGGLVQGTTAGVVAPAFPLFTAVANPYASAIDLTKLIYTGGSATINIKVWDPKLTGAYGLGAFQDISLFGTDFLVSPGGGSYGIAGSIQNTIESGLAFFIQGSATPRTIQFPEVSKTPRVQEVFFTNGNPQILAARLSIKDPAALTLVDGTMVSISNAHTTNVDEADAKKIANTSENVSVKRNNTLISLERRGLITNNDSIQLNLTGLRVKDYQWDVNISNLDEPGREGFLIDRYLNTTKQLSLDASNIIDFTVINTPASYAPDRFVIVFKQNTIATPTIQLAAVRNANETVATKWTTANEAYIAQYEIEKSASKTTGFTTLATKTATLNNGTSALYNYADAAISKNDIYYRVKATTNTGAIIYSNVAKVDAIVTGSYVTVYPNPVSNGVVNVLFANKPMGDCSIQMIDKQGKTVNTTVVQITAVKENKIFNIGKAIQAGTYTLVLQYADGSKETTEVVVE